MEFLQGLSTFGSNVDNTEKLRWDFFENFLAWKFQDPSDTVFHMSFRFTVMLWKLQVRFPNLWHWRRWLHIAGGTLHGDETQTFLGMVKIANCLTSGAADDGREQLEGGAVAQRSQQVSWPWIYASWVENHHRQDARVRRQEHGREDQFRGVREHHWHVGRVGPQEDGGASVIKQQRGIT